MVSRSFRTQVTVLVRGVLKVLYGGGNVNGPRWGKVGTMRARTAAVVASCVNPPGAVVWAAACPASAKATAPATTSAADRRHAVARIQSEVAEAGAREADRAWACVISNDSYGERADT